MDLSSGRIVPADIFQMQATTRYPGAFYIFQIKSGAEGREFYMRVRGCGERVDQSRGGRITCCSSGAPLLLCRIFFYDVEREIGEIEPPLRSALNVDLEKLMEPWTEILLVTSFKEQNHTKIYGN